MAEDRAGGIGFEGKVRGEVFVLCNDDATIYHAQSEPALHSLFWRVIIATGE